jgi:Flp pilus assembly pilin Flp
VWPQAADPDGMWMSLSLSQLVGGLVARLRREEGQTMAEYALILALIAVVTAAVIVTLGGSISSVFNSVVGQF